MSKNKILTRDNLEKIRVPDLLCLFWNELELVYHLFFGRVVAKRDWETISRAYGVNIGLDFESMAKLWLCNKKYGVVNMVSAVVCWGI
jgi:hypothetical protein